MSACVKRRMRIYGRSDREEHAARDDLCREGRCCSRVSISSGGEHIVTLEHLRQVVGWRGMAKRDPLNEYKSEAFQLFESLIVRLREQVTRQLMRIEVVFEKPPEPQLPEMHAEHS